jgi:uncharacterized protein involved in exopolysaccharide biosynthesis
MDTPEYDTPEPADASQASLEAASCEPRARGLRAVFGKRWGVILVVFMLGVIGSMFYVSMQEKFYSGRVQLQLIPSGGGGVFSKALREKSTNWVETECKIMTSRETLLHVVRAKALAKRWSLGNDDNAAVDKLAKGVEVRREPNTEIVTIEVCDGLMDVAAELANAVADAYEERAKEYEKGRAEVAVYMLQAILDSQEKKVEEKRVSMLVIMKKYGIIDFASVKGTYQDANEGVQDGKEDGLRSIKNRLAEYDQEVNKLKSLSKVLGAITDRAQFANVAIGLNLEVDGLKQLMTKHRALTSLPPSAEVSGQLEALNKELSVEVDAVKQVLAAKTEIAEAGIDLLSKTLQEQEMEAVGGKARQSEYVMAKREYEQQLALLNEMREHILKQKVDLEMPMLVARRHEMAYPSPKIVRPEGEKLLAIGSSIALMLGLALAFILEYCHRENSEFPAKSS